MHRLDSIKNNIQAGSKGNTFFQTEAKRNAYLDSTIRKLTFYSNNDNNFWAFNYRKTFLYTLPSKIEVCKKLLSKLEGRTLVFGLRSDPLIELGIPAIVRKNPTMEQDLEDFRQGKINQISSDKILLQGANLGKINNLVIISYDSKPGKLTQKIGRLRQDLDFGKVYIFKTIGTQEEKWYDSMIQPLLVFPQILIDKI